MCCRRGEARPFHPWSCGWYVWYCPCWGRLGFGISLRGCSRESTSLCPTYRRGGWLEGAYVGGSACTCQSSAVVWFGMTPLHARSRSLSRSRLRFCTAGMFACMREAVLKDVEKRRKMIPMKSRLSSQTLGSKSLAARRSGWHHNTWTRSTVECFLSSRASQDCCSSFVQRVESLLL